MLFKEIKQNYPVYILDKQRLKLVQGKVATVSFPRLDMNAQAMQHTTQMVLSTDREGLAREVEAMKAQAEQVLASVEHQQSILDQSNALLAELNPAYKEKRETEERLCNLETGIHTLQGMMSELMNNFKKE